MLQNPSAKQNLKGFSQPARELLLRYSFPGNVRELENMVERAVALGREREAIQPAICADTSLVRTWEGLPKNHVGSAVKACRSEGKKDPALTALTTAREQFEKDYIVSMLGQDEGNRTIASTMLGLSRKPLWEKCKRYGIPSAKNDPDRGLRGVPPAGLLGRLESALPEFHSPIP